MAKKVNVFSNTQLSILKRELLGVIDYLQFFKPEEVIDDVDWKATSTGKVMPAIVSSVEDQFKTCVSVIDQSITMIKAVYDTEGLSEMLQYQIDETAKKLEEINNYYFEQPISSIIHRRLEVPMGGTKKNGEAKMFSVVAATRDKQIQARSTITKLIAKIVPQLESVQSYKEHDVRGGKALSESMERFMTKIDSGELKSLSDDD